MKMEQNVEIDLDTPEGVTVDGFEITCVLDENWPFVIEPIYDGVYMIVYLPVIAKTVNIGRMSTLVSQSREETD